MPPNTRKPQIDLSKPSEGGSFDAGSKPTESTNPLGGLNITAQRELGTVGGVKVTGKLNVGVDNVIGQQGIDIEIDATNRTAGFGAGIGSTKGKLGVNIGGKVGYDEDGNLSIKGAKAGINIAGFGGSASIDEDEGVKGSISAAGATIEIGIDKEGKKSVSVCYGVPGGEVCVTFEPEDDSKKPNKTPTPGQPPTLFPEPTYPIGDENKYCTVYFGTSIFNWNYYPNYKIELAVSQGFGKYDDSTDTATYGNKGKLEIIYFNSNTKEIFPSDFPESELSRYIGGSTGAPYFLYRAHYRNKTNYTNVISLSGKETDIYAYAKTLNFTADNTYPYRREINQVTYNIFGSNCGNNTPFPPPPPPPSLSSESPDKIQLPNHPQHFKPMNCCDKVEEIYKYLGIAKLKRNKFPVSNAFLVPGGSGNDNCFDYYAIMQALFRMLANGLIINPKSKPLGSEWQNVNATAWASAMYEMMAESMSDGNSTQRFEVATIMQLTQMMATLAENGRKIEFVADAIGIEPLPVAEDVPVCFTIYEGHKGFGKKEPKKINVSGLKTDDDVENVLGKMLNPSLIPITAWKFKPGQISINEALRNG
jgi:hypothetical protein